MLIDGYKMYDYILSGANKLISNEKTLNKINVFPIADGDTGTNMSFTMKNILARAEKDVSVGKTLKSISKVAIEESYGNSGTIIASFLYGMSEESMDKESITFEEFTSIVANSVKYAYEALAKPVEGTILTVMKAWAFYLKDNCKFYDNSIMLFQDSIVHSKIVLENTKTQLKELRDANLVDAGAKGFVYFIEGVFEYLKFGVSSKISMVESENNNLNIVHNSNIIDKYCSEFFLEKIVYDNKFIKDKLEKLGNSIILTDTGKYIKVHIHTDFPDKVSDILESSGNMIKVKIEDMSLQNAISNGKKQSIGVFADSIADLSTKFILENQIMIIPMQLTVDNKIRVDRININNGNVFSILNESKAYPKSSQPKDGDIKRTLEYLLEQYEYVIGVVVSDKMSGTYDKINNIVINNYKDRVFIINSKTNAAAQGLIVYDIVQKIKNGENIENIVADINQSLGRYKTFVQIPKLNYAVKSGRVPKVMGRITDLFKIKVIISIDEFGKGIVLKSSNLDKLILKINKETKIKNFNITYTGNRKLAVDYGKKLEKIFGKSPLFIEEASAVVAAFVGENSIGIGYREEDNDE